MIRVPKPFDELKDRLKEKNFPLVGAVDYEDVVSFYENHAERYRQWIARSFQGEMSYLERGLDRRLNPKKVFPELEGVVAVARPYSPHPVGDPHLRYARYLNGPDYHESMKNDLEEVFRESGYRYKICVDTSAVLERTWAALSGIGWIGKNTLFMHPQFGSYLFLGVVFTDQRFHQPIRFHKDYCGNCERCLKACPTQAFTAAHDLDSRKCISYLTLEKRGDWDAAFDPKGFVAGCDLCQEVCPYNTKPSKYSEDHGISGHLLLDPVKLEKETEQEYTQRVEGTALERVKYSDFKRNLKAITNRS